jgi:ABC-type glycerol-3-phosphate transport system permease component
METRKISWWRLVLGFVLVYINGKLLLFPQTRALKPANSAQAAGMATVDVVLMAVGIWLLVTCYRKVPSHLA